MGLLIAIASGIGAVLAVSNTGGINALVGTAISASLLPPIVNTGICLAMGFIFTIGNNDVKNGDYYLGMSGVSGNKFRNYFQLDDLTHVICRFRSRYGP
jgi:hypothetical protein